MQTGAVPTPARTPDTHAADEETRAFVTACGTLAKIGFRGASRTSDLRADARDDRILLRRDRADTIEVLVIRGPDSADAWRVPPGAPSLTCPHPEPELCGTLEWVMQAVQRGHWRPGESDYRSAP